MNLECGGNGGRASMMRGHGQYHIDHCADDQERDEHQYEDISTKLAASSEEFRNRFQVHGC
jgi:hypothetical protein